MRLLLYLLTMLVLLTSCSKLLDLDPPAGQRTDPFPNDTIATQVVLGMLEQLMKNQGLLNGHPARFCGLLGDELSFPVRPERSRNSSHGASPLKTGSSRLSGLRGMNALPPATWSSTGCRQRPGSANRCAITWWVKPRFMRALCYGYLLQLFDHIPLVTSTHTDSNAQLPQALPSSGE